MKVLSIGTDRKLFEQGSAVGRRAILYGAKMEALHIIVLSLKTKDSQLKTSLLQLSPNVFVHPTCSSSRWFYVRDAVKLGKKIIVGEKLVPGDLVITAQDPFECGFVVWRLAAKFRAGLHIQVHTDFLSPYFQTSFHERLRVWTAKFLLPKANGVRVVSERISQSFARAGIRLKHPAQVLPIRVETKRSDEFSRGENINFSILMASRLTKEKRIEDGIRAFAKVHADYPSARLVISGTGPEEGKLKALTARLGLASAVKFTGWQNDLAAGMREADVFLSTSAYEGYGMSMIEAGLADPPVVATDAGAAGDILKDGETALVCPVGDVDCLAAKIIMLVRDTSLRAKLSQELRAKVLAAMPSEEAYVEAYVRGLAETLKTNH